MTGGHLLREHAPISDSGWQLLDDEARTRLTVSLGARAVVDFAGPHGWEHSATSLGRVESIAASGMVDVGVSRRIVMPVCELRADFQVARAELANHDRGAVDVDLADLQGAALRIASAENLAVFHGVEAAGIVGLTSATGYSPVPRVASFEDYPGRVAKAVETLLRGGVGGPFALALGPSDYTAVIETAENGGYPMADHVRRPTRACGRRASTAVTRFSTICERSSAARSSGPPVYAVPWWRVPAAVTFCSNQGKTFQSATAATMTPW